MAISLSEGAKYSLPDFQRGVIQAAIDHSDLLEYLKWQGIAGNAYQYQRESSATAASVYAPGDTWSESTSDTSLVTAKLKIIGDDAAIDEFSEVTGDNPGAISAAQIPIKIRNAVWKYEKLFIAGDEATNSKEFDGLRLICTTGNSNRITMGTNGATLTLKKLDEVIDTVYGKPGMLLMTKRTRRTLGDLARGSTALNSGRNEFQKTWSTWNGIPIIVMDTIGNALTKGTSSVASEIYCCDITPGYGVLGLQNENTMARVKTPAVDVRVPGPQVLDLGQMESKDARKYRVRWYSGMAVGALRAVACLDGVLE